MNISPLIDEAKRLLLKNPRDQIHDLSHHERVWQNALIISQSLPKEIDQDVLQAAVFWHDVMISPESLKLGSKGLLKETINVLDQFLTDKKYGAEFKEKVLAAVKHHNFLTNHQMNTEGKVLFDADKLDALHPTRYRQIIQSIQQKQLSKAEILVYAQVAKLWLKTMRSRYHFEVSKRMHDRLIKALLKDKEAVSVAKKYGVDIVKLVR